jgi:anti-sigma factor ChrR (cupin superfamily)
LKQDASQHYYKAVALDSTKCPPDADIAESYAMGTLPDVEAVALAEHLLTCAVCRKAVEQADAYVRAMRAAGRKIRQSE